MIEFIAGALVGATGAGIVGRAKFLQVQNALRYYKPAAEQAFKSLITERRLVTGLTETLDDIAQRTRIKA